MTTPVLLSRKAAFQIGKNKYFTGKPCGAGHVAYRYVNSGACAKCLSERQIAARTNKPRLTANAGLAGYRVAEFLVHKDDYELACDFMAGLVIGRKAAEVEAIRKAVAASPGWSIAEPLRLIPAPPIPRTVPIDGAGNSE